MEEALRGYPHCRKFRKKQILTAQVFDFPSFAASKKIISLDSDILVFRYPEEVVGWIEEETGEILFAYEEKPRSPRIRKNNITTNVQTPFQFAPNLCGGFVCCCSSLPLSSLRLPGDSVPGQPPGPLIPLSCPRDAQNSVWFLSLTHYYDRSILFPSKTDFLSSRKRFPVSESTYLTRRSLSG